MFSHSISLLVFKSLVLPRYHFDTILFSSYFVNLLFRHSVISFSQSLVQLLSCQSLVPSQTVSCSAFTFCQSLVPVSVFHFDSLFFSSYFVSLLFRHGTLTVSCSITVSVYYFLRLLFQLLVLSVSCSATVPVRHCLERNFLSNPRPDTQRKRRRGESETGIT